MKRFQHSIKKETIVILSIRDEMPENDARTELENKIEQLVKVAKEADKEQIKVMTNSLQISVGMAKSQEQDPMEIEKLTGLAETLKDIEEKNSSGKKIPKADIEALENFKSKPQKKTTGAHVPTGMPLLDAELGGGFMSPGSILVKGAPGTGKTAFCLAISDQTLKDGKEVVFIVTNKFPNEIKQMAKELGYNLDKARFVDMYSWLVGERKGTISSLDATSILEYLEDELEKGKLETVVFDSLASLLLYNDDRTVQRFLDAFNAMIKEQNAISLVVIETGVVEKSTEEVFDYLSDNTVLLEEDKLTLEKTSHAKPKKRAFRFDVSDKGFRIKD